MVLFKSSQTPTPTGWRVTSSPVRAPGEGPPWHKPAGGWENQGPPLSQLEPVGSSHPAAPSILVALGSQEGSPCSPQAAICFPALVLFWPCCYLQFGFLLQTALPEGRLQRPGSELRSGWLAHGWLPEHPAICVWLAPGCFHCGPRGPGWSHFLSVLATAHVPCFAKWSGSQCRLLASHTGGSSRRRRALGPSSPPSSCGEAEWSPTPPCPLFGVPT